VTAVVARRRTAVALFLAALVLGICGNCRRNWETWDSTVGAAAVEPRPPMRCGPVYGRPGSTYCATWDLPGPRARMVAATVLEMRVARSLRGGTR
jgi:hypothetical protein